MTVSVVLCLSDEAVRTMNLPPAEVPGELLVAAAIKLYELGRLSLADAARLASLAPAGFLARFDQQRTTPERPQSPADVDRAGIADLINSMSQHPAMYVGSVSLKEISNFLGGYSYAVTALGQENLLDAWGRWVELRFEIHHNAWNWTRILLHIYGTDEAALRALPELYSEYIEARAELGAEGMERKLRETLLARHGQEWFEPAQTHTRPPF